MFKKITDWHKLKIGKLQNFLMINDYETLWLTWIKGLIMGIVLMSLKMFYRPYQGR